MQFTLRKMGKSGGKITKAAAGLRQRRLCA